MAVRGRIQELEGKIGGSLFIQSRYCIVLTEPERVLPALAQAGVP
jgi:hypothetical protein